jgi:hypothetical protein
MRMPAYYRSLPVTRKLRLASTVTVIAALLLACALLLIDDQAQGRDAMRRERGVQADIFSASSTVSASRRPCGFRCGSRIFTAKAER